MSLFYSHAGIDLHVGSCLDVLPTLAPESVQMCVTSPPYFGLRDYGTAAWDGGDGECTHRATTKAQTQGATSQRKGRSNIEAQRTQAFVRACRCGARRIDAQIGLEQSPAEYVETLAQVFREVRRVLRPDGTVWLNLGSSYSGGGGYSPDSPSNQPDIARARGAPGAQLNGARIKSRPDRKTSGFKPKDLIPIPWLVGLALQQPYVAPCCVKAETDRAWLAALFDGEGTIGIRRFFSNRRQIEQEYQDGFVVYTTVANSDVELLDRAIAITGLGSARIKWHGQAGNVDRRGIVTRRDSYGWRLDGNGAVDVILAIYPYLIAKRKQAIIGYTLDRLNKAGRAARGRGPVPPELQEKRAYLKELIHRCNQREHVDLPSWVQEPKQTIEAGYYLRQDLIWHKRAPMPESVRDRCTQSHEYLLLLAKSERYYFDADAIRESGRTTSEEWDKKASTWRNGNARHQRPGFNGRPTNQWPTAFANGPHPLGRNKRSVWTVNPEPFPDAHFATFPQKLVEPCILAGSRPGDVVLDPFSGAGTSLLVAKRLERRGLGIELSPEYAAMTVRRLAQDVLPLWEGAS